MKLRTKNLLITMLPVLLVFAIIVGYFGVTFINSEEESANELAEAMSKEYATAVKAELEIALDSAKTLSDAMEGLVESEGTKDIEARAMVNSMLEKTVSENQGFYGAWVGFEPNAFDGKDSAYAGKEGHDGTGRYIPYFHREGDKIALSTLEDYTEAGAGDYYIDSLKSGQENITEPTEYEIGGEKVGLVSLTAPIEVNGKTVGVVGVDITTERLIALNNEVKLYETGFSRLISDVGIVVAHPDAERIGKKAGEFESGEAEKIFERVEKGEVFSDITYSESLKTNTYKSFAPIKIGNIEKTWFFGAVILEEEIFADAKSAMTTVITMAIIGALIISIVIYFISGTISEPIVVLGKRIDELANYDFAFKKNKKLAKYADRSDELGKLAVSLGVMRDNIEKLVLEIKGQASSVANSAQDMKVASSESSSASEEVANAITGIAQGASEQANDTETAVQNIEELGSLLEKDAESVQDLNRSATDIDNQREEGFKALEELVENTKKSSDATDSIFKVIVETNENAEKIENASGMIQSIADQTNLLALNAAIEAARAGEAGRGFAVVADEIRELAEQSNNFTGEIKQVIEQLKIKASSSVRIMDDTKQVVESQSRSVEETRRKFERIASAIEDMKSVIMEINTSTEEMQRNKDSILDLMQNLSAIAQENAAGTEEASASIEEQAATIEKIAGRSEELSDVAQELEQLIDKFKV